MERVLKREIMGDNSRIVKKKIFITLIILVIGLVGFATYIVFFIPNACDSFECYERALYDCDRVWLIKEDDSYIWRYEVLNAVHSNSCNVKVRLLKLKDGNMKIETLQNKEMICVVDRVDDVFPEKDMARCNGPLKEELQQVIIDRMHNYLLENLGEINEEIARV